MVLSAPVPRTGISTGFRRRNVSRNARLNRPATAIAEFPVHKPVPSTGAVGLGAGHDGEATGAPDFDRIMMRGTIVDKHRFDSVTRAIAISTTRRTALLALVGSAVAGIMPDLAEAKKHHGHKSKKQNDRCKKAGQTCGSNSSCCQHNCCGGTCRSESDVCCQTVGGTTACPAGTACCDPAQSTVGGCAPAGFTVCCQSTGAAHPTTTTCCPSATAGNSGVCANPIYPHCCAADTGGGCCEAGFPVCCLDSLGGYCCPAGSTCCDTDPSGCCAAAEVGETAQETMRRGTKNHVDATTERAGLRSLPLLTLDELSRPSRHGR